MTSRRGDAQYMYALCNAPATRCNSVNGNAYESLATAERSIDRALQMGSILIKLNENGSLKELTEWNGWVEQSHRMK